MTHRGRVKNGVVVLDDPKSLPEGTEVTVEPVKAKPKPATGTKRRKGLRPGVMRFAGKAKDLPAVGSRNVDHYLYGHPRK